MNITYEHKPAMTFIGYSTSIRPEEGYTKCPEFWDKEYAQKYARLWQTMQPETPLEKAILENGVGLLPSVTRRKTPLNILFEATDILRIYTEPFACNRGSRRALEKAGFCYAGTMKNNAVKNGKILNMALYSTAESKRNRLLFDAKTWCALHPSGVRRCHV